MKRNMAIAAMLMLAGLELCGQGITITYPAGGESFSFVRPVTIRWTSSGFTGNVDIILRRAGDSSAPPVMGIAANSVNDGAEGWNIPSSLAAGSYLIRIRSKDAPSVSCDSKEFSIATIAGPSSGLQQNDAANSQPPGFPQTDISQSPAFANKPDFEIVDIERLAGGVLWAKLRNRGKAAYKGPLGFHVDFGTAADGLVTVPVNVAAGATQSVSLEYYLSNADLGARGCVLVKVVANSDKKVVEINENNNEKSRPFSNVRKIEISVTPQQSIGPYPLPVSLTMKLDVFAAGEVSVKFYDSNGAIATRKFVLPASGSYEFKEDLVPISEVWVRNGASTNCYISGGYCILIWTWVDGCGPDGRKIESNHVKCTYYKPQ